MKWTLSLNSIFEKMKAAISKILFILERRNLKNSFFPRVILFLMEDFDWREQISRPLYKNLIWIGIFFSIECK